MNTQTKTLLCRFGAVSAAIAVTLSVAAYGGKKARQAQETAAQTSREQVIILDAGHGECA